MSDSAWQLIFDTYRIHEHDFDKAPFFISANQIKETANKEPRLMCKQDTRESRPAIFKANNLFILPTKNGHYAILRGEGYIDIPPITTVTNIYKSQLQFKLDTALVGNSEMQHIDYAYAASLIRSIMDDDSLVLTIRGRKYTPAFSCNVGKHQINVESVQTEIDAGYEGRSQIVLLEAKSGNAKNTIIRQLYFPYRQWQQYTEKNISTIFFDKHQQEYRIWHFIFDDQNDYNSIRLLKSERYVIKD